MVLVTVNVLIIIIIRFLLLSRVSSAAVTRNICIVYSSFSRIPVFAACIALHGVAVLYKRSYKNPVYPIYYTTIII